MKKRHKTPDFVVKTDVQLTDLVKAHATTIVNTLNLVQTNTCCCCCCCKPNTAAPAVASDCSIDDSCQR